MEKGVRKNFSLEENELKKRLLRLSYERLASMGIGF